MVCLAVARYKASCQAWYIALGFALHWAHRSQDTKPLAGHDTRGHFNGAIAIGRCRRIQSPLPGLIRDVCETSRHGRGGRRVRSPLPGLIPDLTADRMLATAASQSTKPSARLDTAGGVGSHTPTVSETDRERSAPLPHSTEPTRPPGRRTTPCPHHTSSAAHYAATTSPLAADKRLRAAFRHVSIE